MTPELRDRAAAHEAERRYAEAYDRHCEQAQVYRLAGQPLHERVSRHFADVCLQAYRAEIRAARRQEVS